MKILRLLVLILIGVFASALLDVTTVFAQPVINEVMSSNSSVIQDEDGDYPDWIEIYNPEDSPVNLTGYGLSDDPGEPFKWVFPDYSLGAGEYLLIFASDKNRTVIPNHWETVINMGDEWKYVRGDSTIPDTWRSLEFDDSGWSTGPSGIGSLSGKDTTVISPSTSFFVRKSFEIDDVSNITHALLQIDYQDGFVAYINGTEIARSNMNGTPGTVPASFEMANADREMSIYNSGYPDFFAVDDIASVIHNGENVLAVEVHRQQYLEDVSVIPFLTFGMTEEPSDPEGVPEILSFSVSEYSFHTNYKIKSGGETIVLTYGSGVVCDSLNTGEIAEDISRGRKPDGGDELVFFTEPTPGESNTAPGITGYAEDVTVSIPGGLYDTGVSVEFSTDSGSSVIRYTLDGSEPSDSSTVYTTPISIDSTTVVRARTFETGMFPGKINTNTYLIDENISIPIISISINPADLWDDDIGIYVKGNSTARGGYPVNPTGSGNYYEDWEKPIHIEFYEPDGTVGFSIDAGMKMTGKGSRQYPQKALAIFARPEYGYDEIDYKIFPDQPVTSFKSFVLRTGGQDQYFDTTTYFRDGLHQTLMQPLDLEVQAYRPAVVFLNGVYWGIQNIREKLNEEYLASHFGVDPDEVDMLDDYHANFLSSGIPQEYEDGASSWSCFVVEGTADHYNAVLQYMIDHDESDSTVYEYLKTQIDIENYIDYIASRIYISDPDGPGHNTKLWRPQTPTGRWRWLMYDTEWGFGIVQNPFGVPGPAYLSNFLDYYSRLIQASNAHEANFLMYSLLENDNFKYDFVNRYADHLNTIYSTEQVVSTIMALKSAIEPEVPRHLARWKDEFNEMRSDAIDTVDDWNGNIDKIIEFAELRPGYTREHLVEEFGLSGTSEVTLDVSPSSAGNIKINTLTLNEYPWNGTYFQDIPVKLTAIPSPGYSFAGWTGAVESESVSITVPVGETASITANFVEDSSAKNTIVINEINYNSSAIFDPEDWIELYNAYTNPMDISGWTLKDSDETNVFVIPDVIIPAGGYFVLCREAAKFHEMFPTVIDYVGDFRFGLNNAGETIRLFNTLGEIVDSLSFIDTAPWPTEPDGTGPTLALGSPELDNNIPENWAPSTENGTPGIANDLIFSGIDENDEPNAPTAFSLGQNYPNPFNPVTTIPFDIPKAGQVTIEVYSVTGQRIGVILDNHLSPGKYHAVFTSKNLASGIYFYRIEANGFSETKSMLLLK
ncbi:CotH kinase family protein [Candidatus Latescibacterota bacterium]